MKQPNPEIRSVPLEALTSEGSILQTSFWARFKARFGWTPFAFEAVGARELAPSPFLCLAKHPAPGISLVYLPHGPEVPDGALDSEKLSGLAAAIAGEVDGRVDLVRFDLPTEVGEESFAAVGLEPAPHPIQPPDTVIVDIDATDDDILSRMKSKTRYNVRLAGRKGVSVRRSDDSELGLFYRLYRITAERDRIAVHSEEYYRDLFAAASGTDVKLVLLVAEVEGEAVAANIVAVSGGMGYYLYGASSNRHRNRMPTYLLQWEAMRLCREAGCSEYDLWGIPPTDDPSHPMHGLYRMKVGFGGRIVHRAGTWDYRATFVRSRVFRAAERVRNLYYKRLRR